MEQELIQTFTLCDENGNQYEINEFKGYAKIEAPNNSIDPKIIDRIFHKTKDGQDVVEINGGFELVDPPNNIKLLDCK